MIFKFIFYTITMINYYTNTHYDIPDYSLTSSIYDVDIAIIEDDFSLVKKIKENSPDALIIFISENYHHLHKSFHISIFLYLIKPCTSKDLDEYIHQISMLLKKRNKTCLLQTHQYKIVLNSDDIIYFETYYKQIKVVTIYDTYYSHINNKNTLLTLIEDLDFKKIQSRLYINNHYVLMTTHHHVLLENGDKKSISLTSL